MQSDIWNCLPGGIHRSLTSYCKLYLRYSTNSGKRDPSTRSQRHPSLY